MKIRTVNLEMILKEVADLKLADTYAIKQELLSRVQACNYVASVARDEYAEVLLKEC